MKNQNKPFGLYIHWPFCLKKCPYCDFNSYVMKNNPLDWINAFVAELNIYSSLFKNRKLQSIFFGGGTPSLIPPEYIKIILYKINEIWQYKDIEITLETNPSSIETHALEEFMKNGINRFSIGIQSLKDKNLKFLGRLHSAKEAIEVVSEASKLCKKVSTDFIYSLPHDTPSSWKKDLENIINLLNKLNITHCSLYQLTIEPNTGFFNDIQSNKWQQMNDTNQSILYRHTHKIFNQINWNQYEISNMALNKESECNHNLMYWRYEEYLGIGPGAHSRMTINNEKHSFNNKKNPLEWKQDVINNSNIFPYIFLENIQKLSDKDQFTEKLLMGLRLNEGIIISNQEMQYINQEMLEILIKKNFIKYKNNSYSLSLNGKIKLNAILRTILL